MSFPVLSYTSIYDFVIKECSKKQQQQQHIQKHQMILEKFSSHRYALILLST